MVNILKNKNFLRTFNFVKFFSAGFLVVFGFISMIDHQRYLKKSIMPSDEHLNQGIEKVVKDMNGVRIDDVFIYQKYNFVKFARTYVETRDIREMDQKLEQQGWEKKKSRKGECIYCKEDLVLSVEKMLKEKVFYVEIEWGTADAVCTN